MSADDHFIISKAISDRVGKRDAPTITNGSGIYAATLELVNKCLVVIGSHRGPASVLYLGVEKALAMASGKAES